MAVLFPRILMAMKKRWMGPGGTCGCWLAIIISHQAMGQDYKSSVTATDFDFITESDPSTFVRLSDSPQKKCEMPDKRPGNPPLFKEAFVFGLEFSDNTNVQVMVDIAIGSSDKARAEAMRYVHPLGKLPTALRKGVERLVVHCGGENTTAFSDVGLIVVYADNATKRISTHDLEETIFHESVHAAWDKTHAQSEKWIRAQSADNRFVTLYAQKNPKGEDLAESALFAYTLLHHPERLPKEDADKIKQAIPHRILFIEGLLPANEPIFFTVKQEAPIGDHANLDSANNSPEVAAPNKEPESGGYRCDIRLPGVLADILSNVFLSKKLNASKLDGVLENAADRYKSSEALYQAAAKEWTALGYDEATLRKGILEQLHVNCSHPPRSDGDVRKMVESWKAK